MKMSHLLVSTLLAGAWMADLNFPVLAAVNAEHFLFKDGKVWALEAQPVALEADVKLPSNITIRTNGTFQIGNHPPRAFLDGQILGRHGMLISPNGRIDPVVDHVSLDAGKTVSSVNGERTTIQQDIPLGTDKRLTPDRVLLGGERGWMRVIDGQLFAPNGNVIPAIDTITLQKGKVVVQKDGAQLSLPVGRSIMMNEGTKVFGDGKVVSQNGQVTQLTEGQIISIEGVVKRR